MERAAPAMARHRSYEAAPFARRWSVAWAHHWTSTFGTCSFAPLCRLILPSWNSPPFTLIVASRQRACLLVPTSFRLQPLLAVSFADLRSATRKAVAPGVPPAATVACTLFLTVPVKCRLGEVEWIRRENRWQRWHGLVRTDAPPRRHLPGAPSAGSAAICSCAARRNRRPSLAQSCRHGSRSAFQTCDATSVRTST